MWVTKSPHRLHEPLCNHIVKLTKVNNYNIEKYTIIIMIMKRIDQASTWLHVFVLFVLSHTGTYRERTYKLKKA